MKSRVFCGLAIAVALLVATGCDGVLGDDPDSAKTTAAGAERNAEIPGVEPPASRLPPPTDEKIPGVTAEPTEDGEIPGVKAAPTRVPCSDDSRWAIPACIDDALDAERAVLESTGNDEALDDLNKRSEDVDGLDGYDWQSDKARDLYERAKSLDTAT